MPGKYRQTLHACYLGLVTQAININLAPLFFVIFHEQFGLSFEMLGRLVLLNFGTQFTVDVVALKYVDRMGFRAAAITGHTLSCLGIMGLGILPCSCQYHAGPGHRRVHYGCGSGYSGNSAQPHRGIAAHQGKASSMSLLHSFYCWGQMAVVIITTLSLSLFGRPFGIISPSSGRCSRSITSSSSPGFPCSPWCRKGSRCPFPSCSVRPCFLLRLCSC